MIFAVKVEHYEEWDEKVKPSFMFVCADSTVRAVERVSDYYGEVALESVDVHPFSPDNFLIFNEEDEELFNTVKRHLEGDIIW